MSCGSYSGVCLNYVLTPNSKLPLHELLRCECPLEVKLMGHSNIVALGCRFSPDTVVCVCIVDVDGMAGDMLICYQKQT
jgi:hypothetical protein